MKLIFKFNPKIILIIVFIIGFFFFLVEDLRKYVTTMVCVAVNGKPVLGVIHKPFSQYTGKKYARASKS